MTDFFTRLAERALGLATVIQPISASMFEPVKGISNQDDAFDIMLEEKSQIEETDSSSGVLISGILPPLDKPDEKLVAGTLQQFENPSREHNADVLPSPDRLASVPRTNIQESRNASLQGRHTEVTTADMLKPQISLPIDRHEGIPPTTIQSSEINEVHIQSEHLTYLRDRLENNGTNQSVETATHATMFPGTPSSSSISPISIRQTAQGTQRQLTNATAPALSQNLPEMTQPLATEHPHSMERDAQNVVLETRIMQGTPVTNALNSQQTLFLEEKKRQPLTEPVSSQPSITRSTSEPAIQVTIGRIEVRAIPAQTLPSSPQRQHSAPTGMSLDEYLRKSARGGR
jgi:hypothetical protein